MDGELALSFGVDATVDPLTRLAASCRRWVDVIREEETQVVSKVLSFHVGKMKTIAAPENLPLGTSLPPGDPHVSSKHHNVNLNAVF